MVKFHQILKVQVNQASHQLLKKSAKSLPQSALLKNLINYDGKYSQDLRHCIRAMEKINENRHLNAFTFISSWNSIENQWQNKLNLKSSSDGSLNGLPIAIKDNFCIQGMLTTCGSKMLQGFIAPYTATVVQKLIDAGAVIIGKTNMDEFGMGCATVDTIFGPTKNAWGIEAFIESECETETRNDTSDIKNATKLPIPSYSDWRIPGGSSGGSAVAVATGMCFGALGSDTGGSTRNPAAYCGIIGFKPTYGLLSRFGLIPLVNSLDVPGILTRTVDDCERIFNIIKGYDENDSTSIKVDLQSIDLNSESLQADEELFMRQLKIGIPIEFTCPEMTSEIKDCWNEINNLLQEVGKSSISSVSLPHTKYSIACYSVLNPCEVASNMARYDGLRFGHRALKPKVNSTEGLYSQTRHEGFNDVVRGRILAGNYFLLKQNYDKYFVQAMKVRRLITNDFNKVWKDGYDVLLTPVTLSAAPKYSDFIQLDNRTQTAIQDYCTQSTNLAGIPAITIPIKLNSEGLPLSLQLIGPKFSDNILLRIAKFIEKKVNFPYLYKQDSSSSAS